jgi:hypothetical protein
MKNTGTITIGKSRNKQKFYVNELILQMHTMIKQLYYWQLKYNRLTLS